MPATAGPARWRYPRRRSSPPSASAPRATPSSSARASPSPIRAAPAAELYVSRDGGRSFSPAAISGPRGPRYRCLAHHGGLLYACAGGTPNGDDFLLGVSRDEGRTWTPLLAVEGLAGPEPCRAAACRGDLALAVRHLRVVRAGRWGRRCRDLRQLQRRLRLWGVPALTASGLFRIRLVLVLGLYSAAAGRRPASRSSA
jgi:hypothetical protein